MAIALGTFRSPCIAVHAKNESDPFVAVGQLLHLKVWLGDRSELQAPVEALTKKRDVRIPIRHPPPSFVVYVSGLCERKRHGLFLPLTQAFTPFRSFILSHAVLTENMKALFTHMVLKGEIDEGSISRVCPAPPLLARLTVATLQQMFLLPRMWGETARTLLSICGVDVKWFADP